MKRAPTEAEAILFMDDSSGSPVIMNGRRQSVAPWKLIDARPAPLSWQKPGCVMSVSGRASCCSANLDGSQFVHHTAASRGQVRLRAM
jgi:hypothetical protein